ncbi:cytidine deaminase [Candidatus Poriferisodalis sp.]|uniref:cytidine deaminase n=1 Tax=Candidatus Poriferisodalis sp. TaxID=3101277 RepID=UPI003B012CA8
MSSLDRIGWEELRANAQAAARMAHAPHSGFKVGAAGRAADGRIVSGCNVENSSYGLTLCAECGMVSDLHRSGGGRLVAVAVTNERGEPLAPCGRCRQLLFEAGGPSCIVNEEATVEELLPGAFELLPTERTTPEPAAGAVSVTNASVIALGAYCEIGSETRMPSSVHQGFMLTEEETAWSELRGSARERRPALRRFSAKPSHRLAPRPLQALRQHAKWISFQVAEFADLADGRRFVLRDDRGGWSDDFRQAYWSYMTADQLIERTLHVLEYMCHYDQWRRLADLGIHVDLDSLRTAPHIVELGPCVLARLQHGDMID